MKCKYTSKNEFFFILIVVFIIFLCSSCNKEKDSINIEPNKIDTVNTDNYYRVPLDNNIKRN